MRQGSKSIALFLGNKTFLYDINRNAESDPLVLQPIKVVRMSYCESQPLPLIYFLFFRITKLVLTALNILVGALKCLRKTFLFPEGGHSAIE